MNCKAALLRFRKHLTGILFVLPCAIILVLMMFTPVIQTFKFSFSQITLPSFETHFIGFQNFIRVFSKPEVPTILRNTLFWTLLSVILRFALGFWAAIIMNAEIKGIMFFRVISLLPWTVPSIVSANTWRWIFQSDYGLLNGVLRSWGLDKIAHTWLGDPNTALSAVLIAYTWAGFPFVMMMLLSGMQAIPKELYEAGEIDGANKWQLFRFITVPSLKPIIFIILVLETISGINSFDMLYTMTAGGPGGSSEILGLFIYRLGFTNFDFAGASTVSTILITIALIGFTIYGPATAKKK